MDTVMAQDDETLDGLRARLAPLVAANSAFDGWSKAGVRTAARAAGIDEDVALYAFAGGQMDMIDAWIASVDAAMVAALPAERLAEMKVRARIAALVRFRLDAVSGLDEAVRSALAIMAMPHNAARSLRIGWRSADVMWRLASGPCWRASTPRPWPCSSTMRARARRTPSPFSTGGSMA
jgi:ubiquinone biosynthesis protein COQ9